MTRPSDPLLAFLRDAVRRRSLTTQTLSEKTGIDRSILKRRLAGTEAMTVDDLVVLSNALDLGPDELSLPRPSSSVVLTPSAMVGEPERGPASQADETGEADPSGNLPKQVVQLGFALGIDIMLMFDSTQLGDSGVPSSVLGRFKELLPIRLEARFHPHNKPRFGEDEFGCTLSFDRLYTCTFPWTSFRQVHFLLPVEEPVVAPPPAPEPPRPTGKPFLRVIK